MKTCIYRERHYLDEYRAIDYTRKLNYISYFEQGDLIYFKLDRFNYKVIAKSDIEIMEV